MPDSIRIPAGNDESAEVLPTYQANLIPCHIQYNGAANTNDYFTPSKITHNDTTATGGNPGATTEAYFRGLKLVGEPVGLSQMGYTGYLINKSESIERARDQPDEHKLNHDDVATEHDIDDSSAHLVTVNTFSAVGRFDDLVVYGHDSVVEPNCQWKLIDEWNQISNVIHE